jgi:serine/threonine protein phosphatase PrpC
MVVSALSDTGSTRAVNEDSLLARDPVFVVADGMGGHARGDLASQAAVRVLGERLSGADPLTPARVLDAVHAANDAVRALSGAGDAGAAVAGTTLSGIVRVSAGEGAREHWMIVNVGDSRVYGWDGRTLSQLTVDHSAVQELIDAGAIDHEEARRHPERNVITRALGAEDDVDVDVWLVPLAGHQTFLICSDGLSKELDDADIARILAGDPSASAGDAASGATEPRDAHRLVEAAVRAGGRDNVTAIVVEALAEDDPLDTETTRDRPGFETLFVDTLPRGGAR